MTPTHGSGLGRYGVDGRWWHVLPSNTVILWENPMRHLIAAAALFSISSAAHAQLVQYAAPGGSFAPTNLAPHVLANPLSDVGSMADLQAGVTLPDTVFLQQNVTSVDEAAAVANSQFFHFSLAPEAGYLINLSSVTFDASRGGASTPRGWVLRSSLDGFSTSLGTAQVATSQPTLTSFSVNLPGAFQNLAGPVEFRMYGYAPSTGVGMFYDNLTVNGSVMSASQLIRYEAPGGAFTPTSVAGNVIASNLNETGSAADLQAGVTFPNTVFLQQNVTSADRSAAVANNQYFQFTGEAAPGYELDLHSLSFDAARGGASTPRGWVVRSSVDGFAADIAFAEVPTAQPNLTSFNVDLSDPMFQDLAGAVTFRIYGYAPSTGVGMFYDNITLYGVSERIVPEPTLALLLASPALIIRRRTKGAE